MKERETMPRSVVLWTMEFSKSFTVMKVARYIGGVPDILSSCLSANTRVILLGAYLCISLFKLDNNATSKFKASFFSSFVISQKNILIACLPSEPTIRNLNKYRRQTQ